MQTQIKQCRRCLYDNNHPLGLVIDDEGVCSGCRIHEEKDYLDWCERWERLESIIKPYKSRDRRNYDCIVPVTGAGDSFFIVYLVKEKLGLNPLLVTYNRYYNTRVGIRNLATLRRRFNCDIIINNVNPEKVKRIIRTTLSEFGSFHWPVLAGQSVFPVQTAVKYKIPLIVWGAHQGLEQVGMFSHLDEVEMTRRYRKEHDLLGKEAEDLISLFGTLKEEDIWQYVYPHESQIEDIGVRGIYLGNFVRWDPRRQHELMINYAGYNSAKSNRTFDIYDNVDDCHYMGLHDIIKVAKTGIGKVTDQACREIRHGRLKKKVAAKMVETYLKRKPENVNMLLEWLGIHKTGFDYILSKHATTADWFGRGIIEDHTYNRGKLFERLQEQHIIIGKGYP